MTLFGKVEVSFKLNAHWIKFRREWQNSVNLATLPVLSKRVKFAKSIP